MEISSFILPVFLILINIALIIKLFGGKETVEAQEQKRKIDFLEQQNAELLIIKGRFGELEKINYDLKLQLGKSQEELGRSLQRIANFEKEIGFLVQDKENLQKEKEEWNSKKQTILFELSAELIKKNSAQQEDFSRKQNEIIGKTVFDLNERFASILNKVSSLDDDVKKTFNDINFTKNALLKPGGAGRISEITLENILNASGLKPKKDINDIGDFIMQSHFFDSSSEGKRPDAMVFLPKDHILIIDSKSSSHFLELQQALDDNNPQSQKEVEIKIKESMKRHLEELKRRDYASAKLQELDLKDLTESKNVPTVTTIMFLQTERMLETIRDLDPSFERKALEARIQVLSPVGLINLLYQAKFLIDNVRQEKNIEKLKVEIRKLMESIGAIFKKSEAMGSSIKKSLNSYNEFVGTFNSRFVPRITNMNKLGIESENKSQIEKLRKISFEGDLIEAEIVKDEDE